MLSVLIIGTGGIARLHAEAYRNMGKSVRISGIVDTDRARAEGFARTHELADAPGFSLYTDYREALSNGRFDLVSICTPPPFHCAMSIDSLNAGAHVLLEKPMALSLEECDRILEAAEKAGRRVSVMAQNRYDVSKARIHWLISEGHCGRVLYAQAYSAWWRGAAYYNTWHGSWETEGGGCALNLAIHQIDLMLWLAGSVGELTAFTANVNHGNAEVEDLALGIVRFNRGAAAGGLGELLGSTVHHGEGQRLLFQTERAGLAFPFQITASRAKASGAPENDPETVAELTALCDRFPPLAAEGFEGQIRDFVSLIETGAASPLLPDGKSGRAAVEVVMALYKSAATKRSVSLPLLPDDPFYTRAGLLEHAPHYNRRA
jgi:predicted dehydrogenase